MCQVEKQDINSIYIFFISDLLIYLRKGEREKFWYKKNVDRKKYFITKKLENSIF